MNNELEKQFFDTFGIEPSGKKCTCDVRDFAKCTTYYCTSCEKALEKEYPQITDRILLELICILGNTSYFLITDDGLPIDVDGLKKSVLHSLTLQAKIDKNKVLKHQVRTLFEEG